MWFHGFRTDGVHGFRTGGVQGFRTEGVHGFRTGVFHAQPAGVRAGSGAGLVSSDCSVMPPADSRATAASVSEVLSQSPASIQCCLY